LAQNPWKPIDGAGNQINYQKQKDGAEPPRMIHIEEVKKVQHLVEAKPVSLNIFRTGGILCNQCTENGKDSKENEKKNSKLERPKEIVKNSKESFFPCDDCFVQFFQRGH